LLAIKWDSFQKHADKKKANKPMKRVKKMISILIRIISIARMMLLMLPKAKKPNHFACKMGLHTSYYNKQVAS
jgi:hypothetical protein